ncbi:MAG TPA: hypothetical protein VF553_16645 [Pyrinomonadaceae bacterium]
MINRRGVYRAFVRGRYSSNLYALPFDDALLSSKVGEMRCALRLDRQHIAPGGADRRAFALWSATSFVTLMTGYALILGPVVLLLIWLSGLLRG